MLTNDDNLFKKLIKTDISSSLNFLANTFVLSVIRTPFERMQIVNQNKNFLSTFGLNYKSDSHIFKGKLNRDHA